MNILQKIYYSLSPYVDGHERRIAKFLDGLREADAKQLITKQVTDLIQQDITVFNLWCEWRYRGYRYLGKSTRRQLYANFDHIKSSFSDYSAQHTVDKEKLLDELSALGIDSEQFNKHAEQWVYIKQIMEYLSPAGGRYEYRESSTFGKLLRNPNRESLIGDCNQIVTLYIALFALKFDVQLLQLKTYPGHVALHFDGIDVEATRAEFKKYDEPKQEILPIHEIISINLLDVSDDYYRTKKVPATTILESARLASLISSNQELVSRNLEVAYNNSVAELMRSNSYDRALSFALQSNNSKLIDAVGTNGASFYLQKQDFARALKLSEHSSQHAQLQKVIYHNQGAYLMKKQNYHGAIDVFKKIGDEEAVRNCYVGLYQQETSKLPKQFTSTEIKSYKGVIHNLNDYANKSGNKTLIQHAGELRKHL